jgi:hypothetical protein
MVAKNNSEKIWTDEKMSVPLLRSSALLHHFTNKK